MAQIALSGISFEKCFKNLTLHLQNLVYYWSLFYFSVVCFVVVLRPGYWIEFNREENTYSPYVLIVSKPKFFQIVSKIFSSTTQIGLLERSRLVPIPDHAVFVKWAAFSICTTNTSSPQILPKFYIGKYPP